MASKKKRVVVPFPVGKVSSKKYRNEGEAPIADLISRLKPAPERTMEEPEQKMAGKLILLETACRVGIADLARIEESTSERNIRLMAICVYLLKVFNQIKRRINIENAERFCTLVWKAWAFVNEITIYTSGQQPIIDEERINGKYVELIVEIKEISGGAELIDDMGEAAAIEWKHTKRWMGEIKREYDETEVESRKFLVYHELSVLKDLCEGHEKNLPGTSPEERDVCTELAGLCRYLAIKIEECLEHAQALEQVNRIERIAKSAKVLAYNIGRRIVDGGGIPEADVYTEFGEFTKRLNEMEMDVEVKTKRGSVLAGVSEHMQGRIKDKELQGLKEELEEKTDEMNEVYDLEVRKLCGPLGERRREQIERIKISAYLVGHTMNLYDQARKSNDGSRVREIIDAMEEVICFVRDDVHVLTGERLQGAYTGVGSILVGLGENMKVDIAEVIDYMEEYMGGIMQISIYAKRIEEVEVYHVDDLRVEIGERVDEPHRSTLLRYLDEKLEKR